MVKNNERISKWNDDLIRFMFNAVMVAFVFEFLILGVKLINDGELFAQSIREYLWHYIYGPTIIQLIVLALVCFLNKKILYKLNEYFNCLVMIAVLNILSFIMCFMQKNLVIMTLLLCFGLIVCSIYPYTSIVFIEVGVTIISYIALMYSKYKGGILQDDNLTTIVANIGMIFALTIGIRIFVRKSREIDNIFYKSKKREEHLKEMIKKDPLTNLYNHKYFSDKLNKYIATNRNVCLIIIDIDDFKKVNDNYGHSFGDKVIVCLSDIITNSINNNCIAARYGGEEFAIITENMPLQSVNLLANLIKVSFNEAEYKDYPDLRFSISCGVSKYNSKENQSSEHFFNCADEALYRAKGEGKNKVCIY